MRGVAKSDYRPMPHVEFTACTVRVPVPLGCRQAGAAARAGCPISGDFTVRFCTSTARRLAPYEYRTLYMLGRLAVAKPYRYCSVLRGLLQTVPLMWPACTSMWDGREGHHCPPKYLTPKSSKITLRAVVKLNVPLCTHTQIHKLWRSN